ncbi:MAG: hypothetical protein KJ947_10410 [Alphaproteobacteria bacterium]|nr:hypothetical protein [Alphaproteobacteria bacterium]MBU1549971.1 hypothetical protein [Alphaproteobacteria bacterium]MBU2336573.1 hypothetical protein [Alphaproteobacteria bacterium]MBU2387306.1 hypothetical protein [Alphaproteobacteria bacterium]
MLLKTPASMHFNALMNALNNIGLRDHQIAESLGYSRQYLSLLRSKRPPPARITAQVQALLVSKLAEVQAAHQQEADRLAAQRKAFEAEIAA